MFIENELHINYIFLGKRNILKSENNFILNIYDFNS